MNYAKRISTLLRSGTLAVVLGTLSSIPLAAFTNLGNNVLRSDGSSTDTQAAINAALDGYTIQIPAGSFIWTSGVTIFGKGIKIQGAGGGRVEGSSTSAVTFSAGSRSFTIRAGSTINGFTVSEAIVVRDKFVTGNTMTGTVTSWDGTTLVINVASVTGSSPTNIWTFEMPATTTITHSAGSGILFAINRDATNAVEVSDIRFVKGTGTGYAFTVTGSKTAKQALFHDLRFSRISQPLRDYTHGLIAWKCYFDAGFNMSTDYQNVFNGFLLSEVSATDDWTAANTVGMNDSTGTVNAYIEQCFFTGHVYGAIDFGDNSRGVVRYCVFDNSAITYHGLDTGDYGVRHTEIYNNLFIFNVPSVGFPAALDYWVHWRGGSGIMTDNTVDNISSSTWGNKNEVNIVYQALGRNNTRLGAKGWPGGTDGTIVRYPAVHQPGQGSNGAAAWFVLGGDSLYTATNTYTEGCYFYNNTGTLVVAVQTYPNDTGTSPARSAASYIQLNRDYFTAAPGVGMPYYGYTKYTYPHPLRTSSSSTPPVPTTIAPSNAAVSISVQ